LPVASETRLPRRAVGGEEGGCKSTKHRTQASITISDQSRISRNVQLTKASTTISDQYRISRNVQRTKVSPVRSSSRLR